MAFGLIKLSAFHLHLRPRNSNKVALWSVLLQASLDCHFESTQKRSSRSHWKPNWQLAWKEILAAYACRCLQGTRDCGKWKPIRNSCSWYTSQFVVLDHCPYLPVAYMFPYIFPYIFPYVPILSHNDVPIILSWHSQQITAEFVVCCTCPARRWPKWSLDIGPMAVSWGGLRMF